MKGKQAPDAHNGPKKHVFDCCHRKCSKCVWLVLGGIPLLLGVVAIVMAFVLVAGANAALKSSIEEATVISSTSDESYENFVTTKVGVSFGGTHPDDEDESIEHIAYISNVTNLMQVYTMGARPNIVDIPYSFRRYGYNRGATVEGERLKFATQTVDVPTAETMAKWETDVVFVPNLGWAGLKAILDGLTLGARLGQDKVTLAAPFTQVEDLLRPVFASATLNAVIPSLDGFLRSTMYAVVSQGTFTFLTSTTGDNGIKEVVNRPPNPAAPTATLTAGGLVFMRVNEPVVGSFIPGFNSTLHRPTVAQAKVLFSLIHTSPVSTAIAGAIPTSAAATVYTTLAQTLAFQGLVGGLTAAYATALGGSAPSAAVTTVHAAYLVYHLFTKVTPVATAADKAGFEATAVGTVNTLRGDCGAFYNFGGSGAGGILANWTEIVGTHVGSGALLPALTAVGTLGGCSVSANGLQYQAVIGGYMPNNSSSAVCGAGSTLFDILNDLSVLPSTPELGCTVNRRPSALDRLVGATHYGSRLPAATAAALISAVTTSATVGGASAAALLGAQPGTDAVRALAVTRAEMMAAWPSIVTKAAPLAAAVAQSQASATVNPALEAYVAGNRTAVEATLGVENAACAARLAFFGLPTMTCLQMMDAYSWLDHVARNFAFYPTIVNNAPATTAAATAGFSPTNIMSGPYVKSTAREVLQNGTLDTLLLTLLGPAAARGLALTNPDESEASFLAKNPVATKGTVLNNGATDIAKLWTVMEFDGETTDTTFQSTVLNAADSISYDGLWSSERREPTFDVNTEVSEAPLVEKGFLSTIRRYVNTVLVGEVKGPNGILDLWRYELLSLPNMAAKGVTDPKLVQPSTSDSAWGQPACMIGTRPTDITKPGADVFLSSPHYALCDTANDLTYPDGARVDAPASEFTTVTDVDPVSGFTLLGVQRVGIYVRMSGSDWFPNIPRRVGTKDYYHQLSWQYLRAAAPRDTENDLSNGYDQVRTIQGDLPPGLFSGGALLIIIGLVFLAVAGTYPKKEVGTEQWQNEQIDDSSPQIEGSNPMASKDP